MLVVGVGTACHALCAPHTTNPTVLCPPCLVCKDPQHFLLTIPYFLVLGDNVTEKKLGRKQPKIGQIYIQALGHPHRITRYIGAKSALAKQHNVSKHPVSTPNAVHNADSWFYACVAFTVVHHNYINHQRCVGAAPAPCLLLLPPVVRLTKRKRRGEITKVRTRHKRLSRQTRRHTYMCSVQSKQDSM